MVPSPVQGTECPLSVCRCGCGQRFGDSVHADRRR